MDRASKTIIVAITSGLIGPISIHYVYLVESSFLRSLVLYGVLTGMAPRWIPPNDSLWLPLLIIITGLLFIPGESSLIPVVFNSGATFLLPPLTRYINFGTSLEDGIGEMAFSLVAMGPLAFYIVLQAAFRMIVTVWPIDVSDGSITFWICLIVATVISTSISTGVENTRHCGFLGAYTSKLGSFLSRRLSGYMSKGTEAMIGGIIEIVKFLNQWEDSWIDSNTAVDASTELQMYQYSPIRDYTRNIRLLKLLRRKPFTRIRCQLVQVSLDQTPSYEAISYTWGGQKPEIDIIIDDKHSLVTPSVFEIIRYRQSFFSDTYLWIDAVCINQSSRDDKNQQIALMRNIYQQSTRVIIWLGPRQSVKNSFDTFRMLIHLSFRASYGINQPFPTTLNASDPKWVSVMQMFSHPWFERSWIIQEVVASKVAHVMYGNVLFKWDTLEAAVGMLMLELVEIPGWGNRRPIIPNATTGLIAIKNAHVIAGLRILRQSMSLQDALACSTRFKATDPRDRVFALLGITDENVKERFTIDYHYNTVETYLHTMRHLISGRRSISTVTHPFDLAGIGFPRSMRVESFNSNTSKKWDNLDEELPSWVVDWSSPNMGRNVLNKGEISPQGKECVFTDIFTEDIRVIRMEGYEIDQIIALNNTPFTFDSSGTWVEQLLQLYSLRASYYSAKSLAHSGSATAYPNNIELNNGFWETLTGVWTSPGPPHFRNAARMQAFEMMLDVINSYTSAQGVNDYHQAMARLAPDSGSDMFHFGNACGNRIFAITKGGRLAVVPPRSRAEDIVCYLKHLRSPFLIRPKSVIKAPSDTSQRYQLVGGCFVHGLMTGQRDFSQGIRYELE